MVPIPDLTAMDKGFVWMEAVTGRPKNEEGRILLRIPESVSGKLAKAMNLPSSSGRWLKGTFSGHDSGPILSQRIKERAPYYIQVPDEASPEIGAKPEDLETASGSLVVATSEKKPDSSPVTKNSPPLGSADRSTATQTPKPAAGPQAIIFRSKSGGPLQLRTAKSLRIEADFLEIIDADGKLSLVGKSLVAAILPLPRDGSIPTREETEAALRLYAEKARSLPEAAALLAQAEASWRKISDGPVATTASASLPELADIETAAGAEEPASTAGYPGWFRGSVVAGSLLLIFLAWIWSRPRSYLT